MATTNPESRHDRRDRAHHRTRRLAGGDVIAFANHRHELCAARSRRRESARARHQPGLAHASISRSRPTAAGWPTRGRRRRGTSIIRIAKVQSGKVHDVTAPLRVDRSPAWDPEGKYLYFISTRDFNPVYDALQFDLSFPHAQRPFVVTLRADVPSPFVPQPRPDASQRSTTRATRTRRPTTSRESRIEIDFDGITGRILGVPGGRGRVRADRRA